IRFYLKIRLLRIKTIDDLQRKIIKGKVLEWVVDKTTSGLTFSGFENIVPGRAHLFITNHRDIVLDPAFICYVLIDECMKAPEIAIGDNLLVNDLVSDLIRVNKCFIVKRNLPVRERLKASLELSEYIWYTLSRGISVWIAQRSGRAKDGDDRTNPSIIKMLYMSQRKGGLEFSDFINACHVIPVAVSYELDPCDKLKARELSKKQINGTYEKRKNEDLLSMVKGIKGHKARVHVSFGTELNSRWKSVREVVEAIDRAIHKLYRLWPSNYIAYDVLTKSNKFTHHYTEEDANTFLRRFRFLPDNLRNIVMEIYSRPVMNKEAL
ncbi:MAG: 1-acyl-sn-glycerol-3-phosphate acyltransferase, partial [Spirochaetota bacterium]